MIASVMMQMGNSGGKLEPNMFKHMALNSIRAYNVSYKAKYGEMIIACESRWNWRAKAFAYYKANRKKDREESTLDWEGIFEGMNQLRHDLREYFPYRVVQVDGCEADDIIGVLAHEFGRDMPGGEPILILSGDKDFKQLQTYMNVEQYNPVMKKKLVENNPDAYLLDLIIGGDTGDGVPNVLSPDNCLVIKERQTVMTKKRIEAIKAQVASNIWNDPIAERGFLRNEQLIDLTFTPDDLKAQVIEQYHAQAGKDRSKIFNYLMKNRMKLLMEHVSEF